MLANLPLNLPHLFTLRMKIHCPESRHDELPHLFFIRKLPQSLIHPALSLYRFGRTGRSLRTHRLAGKSEEQAGWQDTVNNPANHAREHRRTNPSLRRPIETVFLIQQDVRGETPVNIPYANEWSPKNEP